MVRHRRGLLPVILSILLLVGLAALPIILHGQALPSWVRSAQRTTPVPLANFVPSSHLAAVTMSPEATPDQAGDPPVTGPTADLSREASLVAGEDLRLRTLLHHSGRLTFPALVPVDTQFDVSTGVTRGGIPTLVLPGPATYTIADILANGAVIPLSQGGYLLEDNVLVALGATLKLSSADLPLLLMDSSDAGFTSLVTWGGTLSFMGDAGTPLIILGWDRARNLPATDRGYGRPYIRAVGGELNMDYVHASYLGFWSGRTGGVAWTGITSRASTGHATSSRFMFNTYGAFVSRSKGVLFSDDLFEANGLDGLRLHRLAVGSTVSRSAAARNAGNGFVVSRGATGNVLKGDLSVNNASNGFLIDGAPLVNGASPSGDNAVASQGTVIEQSDAEGNARTGILVEGGMDTVVLENTVCGPVTGIAVRASASQTWIVRNEVRCGRVALSIGPSVTATTVNGNILSNGRIGLLIRNSPGVRVFDNRITGVSVFGVSVRGTSNGVVGNDNVITGRGFQPVDVRGGADSPTLKDTNLSGWQHRSSLNVVASWRYHPLLTIWVVILVLVVALSLGIRFRRRPDHPYQYAMRWLPTAQITPGTVVDAVPRIRTAALSPVSGVAGEQAARVARSAVARRRVDGGVASPSKVRRIRKPGADVSASAATPTPPMNPAAQLSRERVGDEATIPDASQEAAG